MVEGAGSTAAAGASPAGRACSKQSARASIESSKGGVPHASVARETSGRDSAQARVSAARLGAACASDGAAALRRRAATAARRAPVERATSSQAGARRLLRLRSWAGLRPTTGRRKVHSGLGR